MQSNASDKAIAAAAADPAAFWSEAAQAISWFKPWQQVVDCSNLPRFRWFVGAECNTCYNAVDRHVAAGRGDKTALIYESPVTAGRSRYSYRELLTAVQQFSGVLRQQGVTKGDRIVIYMPMIPETVVAMLSCARLGAIHSVVFGGFAAEEFAKRIEHTEANLIILASCGVEPKGVIDYYKIAQTALAKTSGKVKKLIVFQRDIHPANLVPQHDLDWSKAVATASPVTECTPVLATDPLYILYTSGTTGQPKGVVRDNGGHMVALHWSMRNIYDIAQDDVFWAASDVGWVVGHSYIVYAPLLLGCSTIIFEGKPVGTPDAGEFWRVIARHRVKALFTAPTAIRAIRREDSEGELIGQQDLSSLKTMFLAGERTDPATLEWATAKLQVPVIDHWWQTETGWTICGNCIGIEPWPIRVGSSYKPMPGYQLAVLDDTGTELGPETNGNICIKLPLPPSCFTTLWRAEDAYIDRYMSKFPGYYATGDSGYYDSDGYYYIMSRSDDVINVAGHRLSTGRIEEVVIEHPDIAECAVFGIKDQFKGQVPCCLYVIKAGRSRSKAELDAEIIAQIRDRIGAIASVKFVAKVKRLPKTRSGKILRSTLAKLISGETWTMPATIDDPAILTEITELVQKQTIPASNYEK